MMFSSDWLCEEDSGNTIDHILESIASGGKRCRLAVGGLSVRSHPGRVEMSLPPNPQLLLVSWLVPCMAADCCLCECEASIVQRFG